VPAITPALCRSHVEMYWDLPGAPKAVSTVRDPPFWRPAIWRRDASVAGQYPYPWLVELADGLGAGAAPPETVTSCHTPPDRLSPFPLACPGAVSPT